MPMRTSERTILTSLWLLSRVRKISNILLWFKDLSKNRGHAEMGNSLGP